MMDSSTVILIKIAVLSMSGALLLAAGYVIFTRLGKATKGAEVDEIVFERQMLRQFEGKARTHSPAIGKDDGLAPLERAIAAAEPRAAISRSTSPVVQKMLDRLEAGGLIREHKGGVRTSRPDLVGNVVTLTNGRSIAVLAEPLERFDPVFEPLLRFHDGVLMPGPGEGMVFVQRAENLIGALIDPDAQE